VRRSFRSDGNRPSETLQAGVSWIQWQGLFIVLQIVAVFVSFVVLVRGF